MPTKKEVLANMPMPMFSYCKMVKELRFDSLDDVFGTALTRFMAVRPWERGTAWRKPREAGGESGWTPVRINLDSLVYDEALGLSKPLDVPMDSFCYTAIYWWIENEPFEREHQNG